MIQPYKWSTDAYFGMGRAWEHMAGKGSQEQSAHIIWSYLHEICRIGKFIETERSLRLGGNRKK